MGIHSVGRAIAPPLISAIAENMPQLLGLHKRGKQAGTWERRVEGGEGKASGGREKHCVPTLLHHGTQRTMTMLSGMLEVLDKPLSAPGPAWVA